MTVNRSPTPLGSRGRMIRWSLAGLSLAWVGWLLRDAWVEISPRLAEVEAALVVLGVVVGGGSTLLGFTVFRRIFLVLEGQAVSWRLLAHYFFSAQLMKHLPGRFFGIGYQIAATKGWVSASSWLAANGIHILLMMYLSIVTSVAAFLVRESWLLAGLLLLAGSGALIVAWHVVRFETLLRWLEHSRRAFLMRVAAVLRNASAMGRSPEAPRIVAIAVGSWIVYFGAWVIYGAAYPEYDADTWIRICAYYNIAWLVGYLSFITPSGLGVRELVFAFLAVDLEPGALAYAMLIGRFSLLLVDILLGAAFLGFNSNNERSKPA